MPEGRSERAKRRAENKTNAAQAPHTKRSKHVPMCQQDQKSSPVKNNDQQTSKHMQASQEQVEIADNIKLLNTTMEAVESVFANFVTREQQVLATMAKKKDECKFLQQDKTHMQREVEDLRTEHERLCAQTAEMWSSLHADKEKLKEIAATSTAKQNECTQYETTKAQLRREIQELRTHYDTLQVETKKVKDTFKHEQDKYEHILADNTAKQNECTQHETTKAQLEREVQGLKIKYETLQVETKKVHGEYEKIQEQTIQVKADLQASISQLKVVKQKQDEGYKRLQTTNKVLQDGKKRTKEATSECESQETRKKMLERDIHDYKQRHDHCVESQRLESARLSALEARVIEVDEDFKKRQGYFTTRLREMETEYVSMKEDVGALKQQKQALVDECEDTKKQTDHVKAELYLQKVNLSGLEDKVVQAYANLQKSENDFSSRMKDMHIQCKTMENDVHALKTRKQVLVDKCEEFESASKNVRNTTAQDIVDLMKKNNAEASLYETLLHGDFDASGLEEEYRKILRRHFSECKKRRLLSSAIFANSVTEFVIKHENGKFYCPVQLARDAFSSKSKVTKVGDHIRIQNLKTIGGSYFLFAIFYTDTAMIEVFEKAVQEARMEVDRDNVRWGFDLLLVFSRKKIDPFERFWTEWQALTA